jgi:hypothetical protein
VTFSSGTTSVCSVTGANVSFDHAGTCKVNADQAGNAYYTAASTAQQSFLVSQAPQVVAFTSVAPADATVGATTYTVTASGGASGNPVAFSIDPSTTNSACSITNASVKFSHFGTCVVDANQAGNADYSAAAQVQQAIAVGKGSQAVNFTSTSPIAAATSSAVDLPVTISLDSSSVGCSLSGGTVTFVAQGTCVIDANQGGNGDYLPAAQVQQSFTISAAPTISVVSLQLANAAGNVAGRIDKADAITIGFSAGLNVSSICGAWTGNSANQTDSTAEVQVSSSSPNVVSIASWSLCGTNYHIGTIDLGNASYVNSPGGSGKILDFKQSTIAYNANNRTITITLGTLQSGGTIGTPNTVSGSSVATLAVDAGLRGSSAQTISPATFATGSVKQF